MIEDPSRDTSQNLQTDQNKAGASRSAEEKQEREEIDQTLLNTRDLSPENYMKLQEKSKLSVALHSIDHNN